MFGYLVSTECMANLCYRRVHDLVMKIPHWVSKNLLNVYITQDTDLRMLTIVDLELKFSNRNMYAVYLKKNVHLPVPDCG